MNKEDLINELIKKNNYRSYLEIGVEYGYCFLRIRCKNKIAVDLKFKISYYYKCKQAIKFPYNLQNKYYDLSSDLFFEKKAPSLFKTKKVDCVLIDGLHTFRQSLQDILNALSYLSLDGTIVVHDCYPPHSAAATPAPSIEEARKMHIPDWDDLWCGDVWKSIAYLVDNYSSELDIVTIDSDFGIAIIKASEVISNFDIDQDSFEKIGQIEYQDLLDNPKMINLVSALNYEV